MLLGWGGVAHPEAGSLLRGQRPHQGEGDQETEEQGAAHYNIVTTVMTISCPGVPGPVQARGAQGLEILLTEDNGRDRDTKEVL